MRQSQVITINRSVKILETSGKLQLTKSFAEKNLSRSALKYAEKTDTHYLYNWGTTSYIVVFELPQLFNLHIGELLRFMVVYCMDYLRENSLTDDVMYNRYVENTKKVIKQ